MNDEQIKEFEKIRGENAILRAENKYLWELLGTYRNEAKKRK